jgi:RHS repeat-associated protein
MLQVEQGQVFGVVNDHLGMPKELVDRRGRVAWRAQHGAWGNVVEVTRDKGAAVVASPFRLLGQYADEETGLCYTRFRYFEAGTGRWLSTDPLGIAGGLNLLAFDGAPGSVVDPLGLACGDGEAQGPNAALLLGRKLSALEKAQAGAARDRVLPDGRVRYYSPEKAAQKAGPTRGASLVTEHDPATGGVRSWMESYDHSGEVIRVHPKMNNGEVLNLPHYPPTGKELGR